MVWSKVIPFKIAFETILSSEFITENQKLQVNSSQVVTKDDRQKAFNFTINVVA